MDEATCDQLCKDLRVGADVMAMGDVFPTGQSMMKQAADEIERLRYVLGGVRDAIKTGRNEPLVIWKEQIDIALGEPPRGHPDT